jgi:hypothetical protein
MRRKYLKFSGPLKIKTTDFGDSPKFIIGEPMKVDDPLDILIKAIKENRLEYVDFHRVKKLYWMLDDWMDNERERCSSCQHERSGCQYHDGEE